MIASLGLDVDLGDPAAAGRRDVHRRRAARGSGRAGARADPRLEPADAPRDAARTPGADAVNLGIARDDEAYVERALEDALITCDAVITSGGVSVGDYDVVKAVLDRLGVLQWWQVAIKPAKPFAFGMLRGTPLFGLPGNPVSSHVSFELFARPALRKMSGHAELHRPEVDAIAANAMPRRADGKLHLDRVVVRYEDGHYVAERSGAQASNALAAMAVANGLALLPDGDGVEAGATIRVMLLD